MCSIYRICSERGCSCNMSRSHFLEGSRCGKGEGEALSAHSAQQWRFRSSTISISHRAAPGKEAGTLEEKSSSSQQNVRQRTHDHTANPDTKPDNKMSNRSSRPPKLCGVASFRSTKENNQLVINLRSYCTEHCQKGFPSN